MWTDSSGPLFPSILPAITICADAALPCDGKGSSAMKQPKGDFTGVYSVPCQAFTGKSLGAGTIIHEMVHGCGVNLGSAKGLPKSESMLVEQLTQAIACCIMQSLSKTGLMPE
jgi:hypothetical protein